MSRRSAPGLGQWLLVIAMVAMVLFLLFKLYQYGSFRSYFPAGLTAGGVPIGGLTPEEAAALAEAKQQESPDLGRMRVAIIEGNAPDALAAAEALQESDPQIVFAFVGGG